MQSRCILGPGLVRVTLECTTRRGNWTCRASAENRSATISHTSGCLLAPPLSDWMYRRFPETNDIVGQQNSLFSSTTRLTIVGKVTRSIFKNSSIWSGWASLTETDVLLVGLGRFLGVGTYTAWRNTWPHWWGFRRTIFVPLPSHRSIFVRPVFYADHAILTYIQIPIRHHFFPWFQLVGIAKETANFDVTLFNDFVFPRRSIVASAVRYAALFNHLLCRLPNTHK